MNQPPPHDAELEISVLSAVVQDPAAFEDVQEILPTDEAFYLSKHQVLYQVIQRLFLNTKPVDIHTISAEVERMGKLDEVGGWAGVADLLNFRIAPVTAKVHAQRLRKLLVARKMVYQGDAMQRDALTLAADPDDLRATYERQIFTLGEYGVRLKPKGSVEVFNSVLDRCEAYDRGERVGIVTGFIDLDNILNGLRAGELIILAGRPGMGKSKLAGNILLNLAECDVPVYLFNLEMTNEEVGERLACSVAKVSHFNLKAGKASKSDRESVTRAASELRHLPILWQDNPSLKPSELLGTLRREKRRKGIQLAVVDHMLLMGTDERHATQNDRVGEISRMLKLCAKEVGIPVLALCQMNRSIESRTDETPRLSDLRDSGNIEQDADTVLFLHRPKDATNTVVVHVAKQRNGPTAKINLYDNAEFYRFENYAWM